MFGAQSIAIPVWLKLPNARRPFERGRRLKLLVEVDCSPAGNRAAAWTARIAPSLGECSINLMSVQPVLAPVGAALEMPAEGVRNRNEQLGSAAIYAARAAMGDAGPSVTAHTSEDQVVHELCAAQMGADAIVGEPRDLGTLGKATLASISSALLRTSNCNVIVGRGAVT